MGESLPEKELSKRGVCWGPCLSLGWTFCWQVLEMQNERRFGPVGPQAHQEPEMELEVPPRLRLRPPNRQISPVKLIGRNKLRILTELAYGFSSLSLSYASFFSIFRTSFFIALPTPDNCSPSSSSSSSSRCSSALRYSRFRRSCMRGISQRHAKKNIRERTSISLATSSSMPC